MRIIAGEWRGRKIAAPPGDATRPTADRTRETLFSMLVSRLGSFEDLRVADLFAGSGALGLEALSRGAAHVTFIENDMAAVKVIQANLATLGALARADVRLASALKLPLLPAFNLVLADPPYSPKAAIATIASVTRARWLAEGGWLAIETARKQPVASSDDFTMDVERDTGPARITLLRAA